MKPNVRLVLSGSGMFTRISEFVYSWKYNYQNHKSLVGYDTGLQKRKTLLVYSCYLSKFYFEIMTQEVQLRNLREHFYIKDSHSGQTLHQCGGLPWTSHFPWFHLLFHIEGVQPTHTSSCVTASVTTKNMWIFIFYFLFFKFRHIYISCFVCALGCIMGRAKGGAEILKKIRAGFFRQSLDGLNNKEGKQRYHFQGACDSLQSNHRGEK